MYLLWTEKAFLFRLWQSKLNFILKFGEKTDYFYKRVWTEWAKVEYLEQWQPITECVLFIQNVWNMSNVYSIDFED